MSPREVLDFVVDAWRRRTLEVGSLVITTRERVAEREWNAYGIGRDVRAGAHHNPPRPRRDRRLHVVS
jgi:hypothetical protein